LEALSKPELLALLKTAKAHSTRNWLMILVAYTHGLRASEVIGITRDAIKGEHLYTRRLKGSNETTQTLHRDENPLLDEREALFAFARNVQRNQRLFPITRRQFGRIVARHAEEAGLPPHLRHPHMLKHTMGAAIYNDSHDLRLVRLRLGHKREGSSLIYSGRVEEQAADDQVESLLRGSHV
jgi:type 1 fimbriae regulatory protein FimB